MAAQREASRQPAGGASGASSFSSAAFPPRRDGGAPHEIPSDGGGSNVSHIVHEFGIGEICMSTVVVVNPLALPPSSLLMVVAPAAKQLRLQRWVQRLVQQEATSVIWNYESPVRGVVCLCQVWNSLLAKGGRIFLIVISQYVSTFSCLQCVTKKWMA